MSNEQLLDCYVSGFVGQLWDRIKLNEIDEPILRKAYSLGTQDAILGKDINMTDLLTNAEIIERIKR